MATIRNPKLALAMKMTASLIVPAIPISYWYYTAVKDRKARWDDVRTKIRIPTQSSTDELMVEQCQPGDVVLFDRRCYKCAAGPLAAFSCLLGRAVLCNNDDEIRNSCVDGKFDHCGIVVPGKVTDTKSSQYYDSSNLYLLEATASNGIVSRPLLTRLEMSQSRTVLLLPLCSPGEQRNNEEYEPPLKTIQLREHVRKSLSKFCDTWEVESDKQRYSTGHATLGIIGAICWKIGLFHDMSPTSPSAWLVASALQACGAGFYDPEIATNARVEDFTRDYRFHEKDTIRLRPGWKFLPPVILRETSRT